MCIMGGKQTNATCFDWALHSQGGGYSGKSGDSVSGLLRPEESWAGKNIIPVDFLNTPLAGNGQERGIPLPPQVSGT